MLFYKILRFATNFLLFQQRMIHRMLLSIRCKAEKCFDELMGINTIQETISTYDNVNNYRYEATDLFFLERIIRYITRQYGMDITFADVGCGKGRVLIIAAKHGIRNLIGIEISKELSDIAKANIAHVVPNAQCSIYNMNALEFNQYRDIDVVYLFHPFSSVVLVGASLT